MNDINKVFISGNLTKDPEIANIPNSNIAFLRMTIASNESYKSGDQWKDSPNYIYCQVFGRKIDWLKKNLKMGTLVFAEGKLRVRNWKDDKGNWNSSWSVILNNIRFPIQKNGKQEMAQENVSEDDYYSNGGFGDQGMPADYYVGSEDYASDPY